MVWICFEWTCSVVLLSTLPKIWKRAVNEEIVHWLLKKKGVGSAVHAGYIMHRERYISRTVSCSAYQSHKSKLLQMRWHFASWQFRYFSQPPKVWLVPLKVLVSQRNSASIGGPFAVTQVVKHFFAIWIWDETPWLGTCPYCVDIKIHKAHGIWHWQNILVCEFNLRSLLNTDVDAWFSNWKSCRNKL